MNTKNISPNPQVKAVKMSRLRTHLLSLIQSSTIHGLSVFEKRNFLLKIMWACCFIASIGGCGFFLFESITDYLKFDVVTKMNIIHENPMLFPTVVVCNRNPFESTESNHLIFNLLREMKINLSSTSSDQVLDLYRLRFLLTNNAYSDKFTERQKKSLGIPIDKALLFCSFNLQECTADDFEWYFDMNYGNCYKFNAGRNFKKQIVPLRYSTKEGMIYGLVMCLHVPNTNTLFDFDAIQGIHVFIQNASDDSYITDGLGISKGYLGNLQVKKVVNEKVPYPYSECQVKPGDDYDSYLYKETIKSHKIYKQRDCVALCIQRESIRKCGCHMVYLASLNSNVPCLDPVQINCSFELGRTFLENDINTKCSECPTECNSESFEVSTTLADFSSKKYLDVLGKNPIMADFRAKNYSPEIFYEKLKGEIVGVSVFYGKLEYTKVEQTIKTSISGLISGIGGTFGFFLGLSFLSFIEFVEILLIVLYNTLWHQKRKAKMILPE